ncbi:MAG: nuoG [Ilumatobacteraceae bacterium]|nr:nuoG [Ilumatobacteraceae bacterium]
MTTTETPTLGEVPEPTPPDPNAVSITINGRAVTARKGDLIIKAAEDAGEYIPRFCYHERMSSVGMCRMCLVEVDTGRGPQLMPSCMFPVSPDMKVFTDSPIAKGAQEGVIELLLANHPLDCPVCDKGGECPLQDQSFSHGPGESRYVEEKRHYEKPIPISDLVFLDRERCILCDRCTRFADEVAGDALISFTHRGNLTQVNTFPDEPFASYFSGNTVQICPVGALTASPYRFKARPWDLQEEESTCTTCSVGCRTAVQSTRDELVRYQGVDSDPVNWGWLCDKGRFGFESIGSDDRLSTPLVLTADGHTPTSWNSAIGSTVQLIKDALAAGGPSSIALLGGAHGTNEDAFAFARLAHDVIGTPNVSSQLVDGLPVGLLGLPRATIDQAASAKTVILLAPDLKEELPVLYLRLRDAVEKKRTKIIEFAPKASGLTKYAWKTVFYEPGTQADVVASTLQDAAISAQIATGDVVVVAGRANLAESSGPTVAALNAVIAAVPSATVLPALRRGNVVGATQVGLRPGKGGLDSKGILNAAANGSIECLILLGADPLSDVPDADLARRALAGARRIIAIDTFVTSSSRLAHVVLPAAAYAEKSGTTSNLEGRTTTLAQKITVNGTSRPDWMIAADIAGKLGTDLGFTSVEDITASIATHVDGYDGITAATLAASPNGVVAHAPHIDPINTPTVTLGDRNAYDFRLVVSRKLYDAAVATVHAPSLAPLATGTAVYVNPLDVAKIGTTIGHEVTLTSSKATVVLPLQVDPSVQRGTAWVPFNQPATTGATLVTIGDLIDADASVTDVRIESL